MDTTKRRTYFILGSMGLAVLLLVYDAFKFHGWVSASIWGYGFFALYVGYALIFKDELMWRFIVFGIVAGITELIADYWLVHYTHTLIYPPDEPMLFASPAYMPFSWAVVLIQIGYIGFLIDEKFSIFITSLIVGVLGCMIIPLYEYLAITAEWWKYVNAPSWGVVPIYIFVAEGLLMLSIPDLFDRCEKVAWKWVPVFGVIQGLVMLVACMIAFYLVGLF